LQTHYDILGVEPTADLDTIKRAWRVKILLLHPDKHEGAPDDVRAQAAREMLLVSVAWETLKDPARRRGYDRQLVQLVDAATQAGAGASPGEARADDAGPSVTVTCSGCHVSQQISGTAVRYLCAKCGTGWRFVVCDRCHEHVTVNERWGKWTCPTCKQTHTSYWGGTVKRITCVRCKAATEVPVGTPIFRCSGCDREYQRCECNHYTSFPTLLGKRWRCPTCRKMNERFVDPETTRKRSIEELLDDRGIEAPEAAAALAGHIRPDLDGVARVGADGTDGVVAVSGDTAAVWWRDGRGVQRLNLREFETAAREGRRITLRSSSGSQLCVLASNDRYAESWMSYMAGLGVVPTAPPART
jgi:DnaJ domain